MMLTSRAYCHRTSTTVLMMTLAMTTQLWRSSLTSDRSMSKNWKDFVRASSGSWSATSQACTVCESVTRVLQSWSVNGFTASEFAVLREWCAVFNLLFVHHVINFFSFFFLAFIVLRVRFHNKYWHLRICNPITQWQQELLCSIKLNSQVTYSLHL